MPASMHIRCNPRAVRSETAIEQYLQTRNANCQSKRERVCCRYATWILYAANPKSCPHSNPRRASAPPPRPERTRNATFQPNDRRRVCFHIHCANNRARPRGRDMRNNQAFKMSFTSGPPHAPRKPASKLITTEGRRTTTPQPSSDTDCLSHNICMAGGDCTCASAQLPQRRRGGLKKRELVSSTVRKRKHGPQVPAEILRVRRRAV